MGILNLWNKPVKENLTEEFHLKLTKGEMDFITKKAEKDCNRLNGTIRQIIRYYMENVPNNP